MSNLEYIAVIRELQPLLGKRFDRIRKLPGGTYRMKIGDMEIIIEPGIRLHKTKYVEESDTSDQFVQKSEAELENSHLISVQQINNDRIIEFQFAQGEERKSLVFEMFGKGNCILVKDGKTVVAMKEENWSDREIKKGKEYKSPKPSAVASFRDALSDRYVIVSMMKLPLGKEYSLEILSKCGINEKEKGIELTGKQIECIEKGIKEMEKSLQPMVFYKEKKPIDFGLIIFSKYLNLESLEFKTLSEALDEYYFNADRAIENPDLVRLERRLEEQENRIADLDKEEAEFKQAGDFIYANYGEVDAIIKEAKSLTQEEFESKYVKRKSKIDKKEKSVEMDF
jgi:predicted ribosome quality control (RQC) complex YloA/Tae2 family protein